MSFDTLYNVHSTTHVQKPNTTTQLQDMVLSVEKLLHSLKLPSKSEHRDLRCEAFLEAPLQDFRSFMSSSKFRPRLDVVSLTWVRNCFKYLFVWDEAFARLVVDIDYPMSKWELQLLEEYLSYSLRLLDLLNLVKSSIFHVGRARLLMAHSLGIFESSPSSSIERLRSVEFGNFEMDLKIEENAKGRKFSGKEAVIHQALMEMKKKRDIAFGIVLSSLSGDIKSYLELKKPEAYLKDFEGSIKKNAILKEFKEVNEAKACLIAAFEMGEINDRGNEDVKKLEIKLEEIQKQLDDIRNKADALFSEILAGRNKVLDVVRHKNY